MSERKIAIENWVWHDLKSPSPKTLRALAEQYSLHHLALEDVQSKNQRPKIDEYDNHMFIVFHLPVTSERTGQVMMQEVDLFIGQEFVITAHHGSKGVEGIFDQCNTDGEFRNEFMGKGSGYFLYKLVSKLFDNCFSLLDKLLHRINELEQEVFERTVHHDMLTEILSIKKDLINFRRIIIPQRTVVAQLEHKNTKYLPENLEVYFDDVVDKIEKIWGSLENLKELVESLQETNESIISHNTNNIIKVLTIFSVIMLPLNFVAGVYGMNLKVLPIANHPQAFEILGLGMLTIALVMLIYFKYRRWL